MLVLLATAALMADPGERHVNAPYTQVRREMIAAGYRPTQVRDRPPCNQTFFEDTCRAYPEVMDCSGTGRAYCEFNFVNARGQRLTVVTEGEDNHRAVLIRRP